MIFAFLSGAIVDKLGRRKSIAIFDVLAWSIPCIFWAFSQNFWFFAVAALFNGSMRVSNVAYGCLLIEDAPKDRTTQIYTWVTIFSNISVLFAPISSLLVAKLTLVPAVRILYINAFFVMTLKIILLYKLSTETQIGKVKREESHNKSWIEMLTRYKTAYKKMVNSRGTKFSIIISILVEIVVMIGMTFWQILASRRIGIPDVFVK